MTAVTDTTRTADEIALETINHFLTMWFISNPQCADELASFHESQNAMRALCGGNPETETHLLLVDARQWVRSLTGREWAE